MKSNAPKMNPNSSKILRESGGRGGGLSRPIGSVKQRTLDSIEQPTFQPSISKKSKQLFEEVLSSTYHDDSSPSSHSKYGYEDEYEFDSVQTTSGREGPQRVYERSQRWLQEKQLRMAREKALREEAELRECSFKPKVKGVPLGRDEREDSFSAQDHCEGGYIYTSSSTGGKSLADRQAEWQRNR